MLWVVFNPLIYLAAHWDTRANPFSMLHFLHVTVVTHVAFVFILSLQEIDVKAGGGHVMPIGEMIRQWLTKLEWYSTLFPRIPVPVQKDLMQKLKNHQWTRPEEEEEEEEEQHPQAVPAQPQHIPDDQLCFGEAERMSHKRR